MSAEEGGDRNGDPEERQLLTIFPAEVWLNIFGNVRNAKDFQRMSSASPYFQSLLQPLTVQVLFPEVLQIILQQQPRLYPEPDEGLMIQMQRQLLPPKELLPLRLVCRAWKRGVEHALHDPHFMLLSDTEKDERQDLMKPKKWRNDPNLSSHESFETAEHFTRFQQHFNETAVRSSPFFCRGINLCFPRPLEHYASHLAACLEFLERYGVHVWYCSLDYSNIINGEQRLQFYCTGLKQILRLMPHLRVCQFTDGPMMNHVWVEMHRRLVNSPTPMPTLKHLQKINVNGLALPFFTALVQKNPHVSIVSDARFWTARDEYLTAYLEQCPNLTRLDFVMGFVSEFEAFENARIVCPLSMLHLKVRDDAFGRIGLRRLFSTLEPRFYATLTELWLDAKPSQGAQRQREIQLFLPCLKKLTFIMRGRIVPLDFMLPLEDTLEELTVGCYGYPFRQVNNRDHFPPPGLPFCKEEAKNQDRTIKLYQFWVELAKSNIWMLFPKLKILRTEDLGNSGVCTRREWIATL